MVVRVVLDTNIIVASLSSRSKYRIIIDRLFEKAYNLIITSEILLARTKLQIENVVLLGGETRDLHAELGPCY